MFSQSNTSAAQLVQWDEAHHVLWDCDSQCVWEKIFSSFSHCLCDRGLHVATVPFCQSSLHLSEMWKKNCHRRFFFSCSFDGIIQQFQPETSVHLNYKGGYTSDSLRVEYQLAQCVNWNKSLTVTIMRMFSGEHKAVCGGSKWDCLHFSCFSIELSIITWWGQEGNPNN